MRATAMTTPARPAPIGRRPSTRARIAVEILVCGNADRADDGVGLVVADALRDRLPSDVRLRVVGQLQVDDLLAVAPGAAVVVVDAATGVRGGRVVQLPLDGLLAREDELRPRSSHALGFREVLGVAEVIRGHPLVGRIVAVGGVRFGLGGPMSPSVVRAIPAMVAAVDAAVAELRT